MTRALAMIVLLTIACDGEDGGLDAGPPFACPSVPPSGGDACDRENAQCVWERCPETGVSSAQCIAGAWNVESLGCEAFDCMGMECDAESICRVQQGGALLIE